jgi:FkbM family methyltransferase
LQAGSGRGVYPKALSEIFKEVVSVEADPWNFSRLPIFPNVRFIHAGLWDSEGRGSTRMFRKKDSLTNFIVDGDEFPLITIDSLNLKPDLIWLDIEGSEYRALKGATRTLKHCSQVIIEEAGKGLEKNVNSPPGGEFLKELGFSPVFKSELDVLYRRVK